MYFIAGSGMLFAAFLLVFIGHRVLNRPGAALDPEAFGLGEAISLVFTGLIAFGMAALLHATLSGPMPAALGELAASVAVLAVACIAVRLGLNRLFPRDLAAIAGGPAAQAGKRGRPGHEPRPLKPAGPKARRAA